MVREMWKAIPGFSGYEASNLGNMRSWKAYRNYAPMPDKPRPMYPQPDKDGYLRTRIYCGRKCKMIGVARAVLLAWRPNGNPSGKLKALHVNGINTDNRLKNLYWGTTLDNSADSIRHGTWYHGTRVNTAKLNEEKVRYVKQSTSSHSNLARELDVSVGAIWHIRNGRTWKHVK